MLHRSASRILTFALRTEAAVSHHRQAWQPVSVVEKENDPFQKPIVIGHLQSVVFLSTHGQIGTSVHYI